MPINVEHPNVLKAMLKQVDEGFIVVSQEGKILDACPEACALVGYESDAIKQKSAVKVLGKEMADWLESNSSEVSKPSQIKQTHVVNDSGKETLLEASCQQVHIENEVVNVVMIRNAAIHARDEDDLYHKAMYDQLTGLANRNNFKMHISDAVTFCKRYKDRNFAVLYCDLNKFKPINDNLGHEAGDEILKKVAERLKKSKRESDLVARVGGDEFLLLAQQVDSGDCFKIAQRIIDQLDEPFEVAGKEVELGASIGISIFPDDAQTESDVLHHADLAMYASKKEGHSAFRFFTEELLNEKKE
jgi:diguanylate cyclase (GGDEF)-like protein/PAS domain S-box-containing protein